MFIKHLSVGLLSVLKFVLIMLFLGEISIGIIVLFYTLKGSSVVCDKHQIMTFN